jgi:hypothetical protein
LSGSAIHSNKERKKKLLWRLFLELIETGLVEWDKRRRWQEPGKHYNDIFRLKKKNGFV